MISLWEREIFSNTPYIYALFVALVAVKDPPVLSQSRAEVRYIDMSYLRDGEEPTRLAFCSLGQSRRADDAPSEEQPRPTPLVDGSFYPASSVSASVDLNQGEMRAFTRKCRLFFLVHVLGL